MQRDKLWRWGKPVPIIEREERKRNNKTNVSQECRWYSCPGLDQSSTHPWDNSRSDVIPSKTMHRVTFSECPTTLLSRTLLGNALLGRALLTGCKKWLSVRLGQDISQWFFSENLPEVLGFSDLTDCKQHWPRTKSSKVFFLMCSLRKAGFSAASLFSTSKKKDFSG